MCHGVALPLMAIALLATPILLYDINSSGLRHTRDTTKQTAVQAAEGQHAGLRGGDNALENLFHFAQISDLHISKFSLERSNRLERWFSAVLPVIKPKFLLVSGDITDANRYVSLDEPFEPRGQIPEEWMQYEEFTKKYGKETLILDIRGNHDAFNVPSWQAKEHNYFKSYSARPNVEERHYKFDYKDDQGHIHRFVFIDAVVEPAPSRHFFGELKEEDLDAIENLLSASPEPMTRTVVSHYPFNSIHSGQSSAGRSLSEILDHYRVVSLLSGHLHRVGLFAPLYGRHESGTLELELGDFKHNSVFRISAFDRGNYVFKDTTLTQFLRKPTVLVTSPVDARFTPPNGPTMTQIIKNSRKTAIRFIIFSKQPISGVQVQIDSLLVGAAGSGIDKKASDTGVLSIQETPLYEDSSDGRSSATVYTMEWPKSLFKRDPCGHMVVKVLYSSTHTTQERVRFCKDGTVEELPSRFSQWFTTHSFQNIVGVLSSVSSFSVTYVALLGTLIFKTFLGKGYLQPHFTSQEEKTSWGIKSMIVSFLCKIYGPYIIFLCVFPKTFYFLFWTCLYTALGPWFIGRLYDGEWTALFSWGHLTFSGTFLPHYDSGIYVTQIVVLGLAPFLQLMSMIAVRELRSTRRATGLDSKRIFLRANKDTSIVASVWTDQEAARPRILVPGNYVSSPTGIAGICLLLLLFFVLLLNLRFTTVFHGLEAGILCPLFWFLFIQTVVAIRMMFCPPSRGVTEVYDTADTTKTQ